MIDFPAFVQGLFYAFVIVLMIAAILFFRKSATRKAFSKDSRALLLLMSLGGIFITALLIGVALSSWKAEYRHAKSDFRLKQELNLNEYSFIDRTFRPLGQEYRQLRASIDGLDKMKAKIRKLKPQHANHKTLLEKMLKTFTDESKMHNKLYKQVNLEIRNAMILSATTQDSAAVQTKFYTRAKVLHAKAVNARKRVSKKLGETAGLLADSLIEARRNLHKRQKRTKKKNKQNKVTRLYYFPDPIAQRLLTFLGKYDVASLATTRKIIKVIITAGQHKDTMQVLSQREKELKVPLEKTMQLWRDAEIEGQKYWGNILYSLEAAYLADQFNMPHHNPAYRSLMRDLKQVIPEQLNKLVQTQREVANSFISPDFVESRKHK
ncbi:MAG: hypothetical protein V3U84_08020 [Thiotrichaceae bacterium]